MHHINHNIKFYRTYKKMTQREMAELLDTTLGQVKTYENVTVPPVEVLITLSDVMAVSIDALVKVKINEVNYLMLRKEQQKEKSFLDSISEINTRLDSMERKIKRLSKDRVIK